MGDYIKVQDLEVYKEARKLSKFTWEIFNPMPWQDQKAMGFQFITSADSVGANIAEGYSRFHYLDKVKFYYISRASLSECCDHWLELLYERGKILSIRIFDQRSRTAFSILRRTVVHNRSMPIKVGSSLRHLLIKNLTSKFPPEIEEQLL